MAGAAERTEAFGLDARVFTTVFLAEVDLFATLAEVTFFAAFLTLAHRAFCVAAILARAPALRVRRFVLLSAGPDLAGFLAVDAPEVLDAAFFVALLDFAQRAFWAAAILARPAALILRLVMPLPGRLVWAGQFGFRLSVVPVSSAFACFSRDISASICATISCRFTKPSGIEGKPPGELKWRTVRRLLTLGTPWERK